ncbi:hypothetical protein VU04_08955 [Desulfobulbus sp. TB]|nr:hypothetical protein [Desulfobulbus sp. TB]
MKGKEYYKYGSPIMMEPWIREKELYISPDFKLADLLPEKISLENMYEIISRKKLYTYEDTQSIQKKQYKKEKYLALQDVENGYTPDRMLEILKDRVEYLIKRGSTLNNPHIPFSYFAGWCEITENHADHLRRMVKEFLYSL